jgi:hypothetical protein
VRIFHRANADDRKKLLAQEIERAYDLCPKPDPVCIADCPDYTPGNGCHRGCSQAPVRLSSEGIDYPLEERVAPLVFELKRLGTFEPCWSCEGHDGEEGEIRKLPRVWFYSDSVVHVRALARAVDAMYDHGQLNCRWRISLTFSEASNPDTAFSLEPECTAPSAGSPSLAALQTDLRVIARHLRNRFEEACHCLQNNCLCGCGTDACQPR